MTEDQNRSYQDKFMLRLPDGMRERLRSAAERNQRSINSEIVHRLEQSFLIKIESITDPFEKIKRLSEEISLFSEKAQEYQNALYKELELQRPFSAAFHMHIFNLVAEWLHSGHEVKPNELEQEFANFRQWLEESGKAPRAFSSDPYALSEARKAFLNWFSQGQGADLRPSEI
ncbi:Arc family DNA-binding protein [Rhizobium lemnae]|uniref:Arc family DNA-binding protein n=1 Tax=Rhizobium lemnae TaxID=1214924 RepID=A0ABV8E9X1_9HYPH|nr:Arc family DNA-binding protein [Rhizobium lemnae]MCJ8509521.1 Arc family DNA-binding protein [Rhizobium lemnae]